MIPPSWIRSAVKNRRSLKYTGALSPSYLMRGSAEFWSFGSIAAYAEGFRSAIGNRRSLWPATRCFPLP